MRPLPLSTLALLPLAALAAGCPAEPSEDSGTDTADTAADTGVDDTADTADTADSGDIGDTAVPDVCPDYAAPLLGACLAWSGAAPDGFDADRFTASVTGTVAEVGTGTPPVTCAYADVLTTAPLGQLDALGEADAAWLRVVDGDGAEWTLALRVPGFVAPTAGDTVTLAYDWRRGFSRTAGTVVVSDAAGAPLAWYANEAALASLQLPEGVTVAAGERICDESSTCARLTIDRLEVTAGGETLSLAPGDEGTAGGWHASAGQLADYALTGECEDGPEDVVELGLGK